MENSKLKVHQVQKIKTPPACLAPSPASAAWLREWMPDTGYYLILSICDLVLAHTDLEYLGTAMEEQNLSPFPHLSGNDDKAKWSLSSFIFCGLLPSVWPRLLGFCCCLWDFQMLSCPSPWLVSIQNLVRSGTLCPVWLWVKAISTKPDSKKIWVFCQTKHLLCPRCWHEGFKVKAFLIPTALESAFTAQSQRLTCAAVLVLLALAMQNQCEHHQEDEDHAWESHHQQKPPFLVERGFCLCWKRKKTTNPNNNFSLCSLRISPSAPQHP